MNPTRRSPVPAHRFFWGVALVALAATALPAKAGPFGFEMGMTVEQVKKLVSLKPALFSDECFIAWTAPKPHSAFQSYGLCFNPRSGLSRVTGDSVGFPTDRFGTGIRRAFAEIESAVSAKYGNRAAYTDETLGNTWRKPEDWMKALQMHHATLKSYWGGRRLPANIAIITLEAVAGWSLSEGRLRLAYVFDNDLSLRDPEKTADDEAL